MESKITFQYAEPKDGIARAYADNLCVAQSDSGLRLIFGEVIDVNPERTLVENRVVVTLTWLEAKRAVEFIQSYIAQFERSNGEVRRPLLLPNPSAVAFNAEGKAELPAPNTRETPGDQKVN